MSIYFLWQSVDFVWCVWWYKWEYTHNTLYSQRHWQDWTIDKISRNFKECSECEHAYLVTKYSLNWMSLEIVISLMSLLSLCWLMIFEIIPANLLLMNTSVDSHFYCYYCKTNICPIVRIIQLCDTEAPGVPRVFGGPGLLHWSWSVRGGYLGTRGKIMSYEINRISILILSIKLMTISVFVEINFSDHLDNLDLTFYPVNFLICHMSTTINILVTRLQRLTDG